MRRAVQRDFMLRLDDDRANPSLCKLLRDAPQK
jgi:hypothetical protein